MKIVGKMASPFVKWGDNSSYKDGGLTFNPFYNPYTGELDSYRTNFKGLHIKQKEKEIVIDNSFSKYARTHNAYDLTFSQTQDLISKISEFSKIQTDKLYINKMAIGFTVPLSIMPSILINLYKFHKTKAPAPMLKNGQKYGVKFFYTHYSIKMYDKYLEQKLHYKREFDNRNLLRIEIGLNRQTIPKTIGSLADLLISDNWQVLFDLFLNKFHGFIKTPLIDYPALEPKDLAMQIAKEEPRYWEYLKERNKETCKKYRKRFDEEMSNGDTKIHDELELAIKQHFASLLDNSYVPSFKTCNIP